jgi:hypothetical protein
MKNSTVLSAIPSYVNKASINPIIKFGTPFIATPKRDNMYPCEDTVSWQKYSILLHANVKFRFVLVMNMILTLK